MSFNAKYMYEFKKRVHFTITNGPTDFFYSNRYICPPLVIPWAIVHLQAIYFNNPLIIQITHPTFIPIVNPKFKATFPLEYLSTHHIFSIQYVLTYNPQLQPIKPTFSEHCSFIRKFTICKMFDQNSPKLIGN